MEYWMGHNEINDILVQQSKVSLKAPSYVLHFSDISADSQREHRTQKYQ